MSEKEFLRSPLFYVGDKYKLLPQIVPNFPNISGRFIEVFAGGGSVFMNSPSKEVFVNDIDKHLVGVHSKLISYSGDYRKLIKDVELLIEKYALTNSSKGLVVDPELKSKFPKTYFAVMNKESYNKLKKDFNISENKDYLALYILLIFGFNRMLRFNGKGEFNIPVGNVDFNKNVEQALINYLNVTKSKKIHLYNLDYKDFLKELSPKKGDFIYLDPPYLITGSEYNKLWNEDNEKELYEILDKLHNKGVMFMISNVLEYGNKDNPILRGWSTKYNLIDVKSNYINRFDNRQKQISEILVKNYA